jgi:hypothetical protein
VEYIFCLFIFRNNRIIKRKFKQWWSTIPPISTKRTITSNLNSLNTKKKDMLKIQVLAWDRHKNVALSNQLMESQLSEEWSANIKQYKLFRWLTMFRIPQKMIGYYRTQTIKLPTIFLTGHRCSYQEGKVGIPLTGLFYFSWLIFWIHMEITWRSWRLSLTLSYSGTWFK